MIFCYTVIMDKIENLSNKIYEKYGTIKRARGSFLYTAKGVRLTDMYQENGRAILGYGGSSAYTMLKNALNRGATGSFRTDFSYRLEKAVSELLNSQRKLFIFTDMEKALETSKKTFGKESTYYRPWHWETIDFQSSDAVILEPPVAFPENYIILAIKKECVKENLDIQSARIPSFLESAFSRAIYNLIQAMQEREEKHWFIYDNILGKYWTRKGPYLFPKIPEKKYDDFAEHCLNLGIVINPSYENPSIIPFGVEKGVFAVLKNNPFEVENA